MCIDEGERWRIVQAIDLDIAADSDLIVNNGNMDFTQSLHLLRFQPKLLL